VQVDFEYIVGDGGEYTHLKTKAGRLRDKDFDEMQRVLDEAGITSVEFVSTTYKPGDTEFLNPMIWDWINTKKYRND
jgi:hypothetical protein